MGLHSGLMGADTVKTVMLNGKRLQTGRDVLDEHALVALAGFGRSARVRVTVREKLARVESARELGLGDTVDVVDGLVIEVKARLEVRPRE